MRNKITIDHTPSFTQNNSLNHDTILDSGYDFSDDMIDEHVGIGGVPIMASPRENSQYDSLCRVLKSVENIQNTNLYNNQTDKYLINEGQNMKTTKMFKKIPEKSSHYKSTINYQTTQTKASNVKTSGSRFEQNINDHLLKKQKKMKDLKQILQNNQMKQCTFAPNTVHSGKDKTPKRNLEQFLKNQSDHVNKISKKRQDLKKKTQQFSKLEESFRPKINKTLNDIDRNRNKKPAHERLYELKQNKSMKSKLITEQTEHKSKIKPKYDQTRNNTNKVLTLKMNSNSKMQQIDCPLYQDAERRNNLLKSKESLEKITKLTSKNNQKYGAQKFIKQFCYVLECMKLLPPITSGSMEPQQQSDSQRQNQDISARQFNFSQFYGIMKGLGFLMYDQNCQNQLAFRERSLAFEGFQILEQYGVNIRNVCVFLLSVLGIFNVNPVNFYDSNIEQKKKYELEVNQKQGRKLHKYFDLLYCNYLTSRQKKSPLLSHNTSTSALASNFISPRHDQHTKQLANKYRTKMIERANQRFISNNIDIVLPTQNNLLTHEDLLVIDRLGKNLEMKKIRQDKNSYLDQQCTFYPKVNHNISTCLTQRDRQRGQEKSRELYEHAKTKQQMERSSQLITQNQNQSQGQNNRTNNMHGLSQYSDVSKQHSQSKNNFDHSSVSGNKVAKSPRKNTKQQQQTQKKQRQTDKNGNQCLYYAKDVDKAVARMALGRKQRQLKNKLLERGQPDYSAKKTKPKSPNKPTHTISSIDYNPQSITTRTHNNPQATQREATSVHQFQHLYQDSASNNNEPFLVIDINMGSEMDQIEFYTGDEKKVGKIVDQFCIDHDLDDECKEQLLQLVEIEMLKYLNNIGAESTEC